MIVLINCGGSGTRLWPLSTPEFPKHLLKLDGTDGRGSLVQNTFDRVKDFAEHVYFITEASHAHHIKQQLPDVKDEQIIIEPDRRGTASCIIYALSHIKEKHSKDVPLAFINADHVIHDHDAFHEALEHSTKTSQEYGGITLFGVEPSYPATGFGYIEKGERISADGEKDVHEVAMFKEKPDRKTAEQYIQEGRYYWNSGNFAAPLEVWEKTMEADSPDLYDSYSKICTAKNSSDRKKVYLSLEENSIDYALMEPAKRLLVVPGSFDWMDVGNFQDLHTAASQDENGNAVEGSVEIDEVSSCYVRNDTKHKVAVIGLDNVAVVMTKNGLLVTNRNHSQKVGEVSKRLNDK